MHESESGPKLTSPQMPMMSAIEGRADRGSARCWGRLSTLAVWKRCAAVM